MSINPESINHCIQVINEKIIKLKSNGKEYPNNSFFNADSSDLSIVFVLNDGNTFFFRKKKALTAPANVPKIYAIVNPKS